MDYKEKYEKALQRAREIYKEDFKAMWLENLFPELQESEDERVRKNIKRAISVALDYSYFDEETANNCLAWLEKQGGKHPADKVEPKFKKEDWIIHQGTGNIYQVVARIDNQYQLRYGDNYTIQRCTDVERCARLWNISDAKDGDVLVEDSCIFIIQKLNDNSTAAKTYCTLHNDGDFVDGSVLYFDIDSTKPATKEQRDLLFAGMRVSGYEWNPDTKELKKIAQKPYGQKKECLDCQFNYAGECKGFCAMKRGEQTPAGWSEEDEYPEIQGFDVYNEGNDIWQERSVERDTIGQFTGLRDKNGKEIYEGDIVITQFSKVPFGVVTWHPNNYFFVDSSFGKWQKFGDDYTPIGEFMNRIIDKQKITLEVIGNIHDNKGMIRK